MKQERVKSKDLRLKIKSLYNLYSSIFTLQPYEGAL
jgi:hypothetical protein